MAGGDLPSVAIPRLVSTCIRAAGFGQDNHVGLDEEPLAGTNMTAVVRVGDTIRRPRKPSSEAVQTLLRHLHDAGFDGCPEPLGFDEQNREVLSYVDGQGGLVPLQAEAVSDRGLREHARLIRRFHDAAADFPLTGCLWEPLLSDPAGAATS